MIHTMNLMVKSLNYETERTAKSTINLAAKAKSIYGPLSIFVPQKRKVRKELQTHSQSKNKIKHNMQSRDNYKYHVACPRIASGLYYQLDAVWILELNSMKRLSF